MASHPEIERFEASNGAQIFRLPLEVFSGYMGYAHLVLYDGELTLVDVGSGFGRSHSDLLAGLAHVTEEYGVFARLEDLDNIIITHGHIDHFGGLVRVKEQAVRARVAVHALSRPVLVNYDERVLVTRTALVDFLGRAGVPADHRQRLLDMYMMGKQAFKPVPVDVTLRDNHMLGGLRAIHVPGHAPGLIMLQVGDVLLSADHVLPQTSVALAPESIMPYTGVGHYIESLEKAACVEGVRLALGGHEWPMLNYYEAVRRTRDNALAKVGHVLDHCHEPRTIYEIATAIYGEMDGYGELLRIEQTGARVEYLHQRGMVMIENLSALEAEHSPPLRFGRVAADSHATRTILTAKGETDGRSVP